MGLTASLFLVGCGSLPPPSDAPSSSRGALRTLPFELEVAPGVIDPGIAARTQPKRLGPPLSNQADAVPRVERIATGFPNAPYSIKGVTYEPLNQDVPMKETGTASWYGADFHGKPASTGERFDMGAMSAAHPTMPLPSYAIVRNLDNGRQIVVRVNDRGPFIGQRIIDLSRAAALKLGISGLGRVEVERITNEDIRTGAWKLSMLPFSSEAVAAFAP